MKIYLLSVLFFPQLQSIQLTVCIHLPWPYIFWSNNTSFFFLFFFTVFIERFQYTLCFVVFVRRLFPWILALLIMLNLGTPLSTFLSFGFLNWSWKKFHRSCLPAVAFDISQAFFWAGFIVTTWCLVAIFNIASKLIILIFWEVTLSRNH